MKTLRSIRPFQPRSGNAAGVISWVSVAHARCKIATDESRLATREIAERKCGKRDQDNALGAWPQHGLLGTRPGPNKNRKKW